MSDYKECTAKKVRHTIIKNTTANSNSESSLCFPFVVQHISRQYLTFCTTQLMACDIWQLKTNQTLFLNVTEYNQTQAGDNMLEWEDV